MTLVSKSLMTWSDLTGSRPRERLRPAMPGHSARQVAKQSSASGLLAPWGAQTVPVTAIFRGTSRKIVGGYTDYADFGDRGSQGYEIGPVDGEMHIVPSMTRCYGGWRPPGI